MRPPAETDLEYYSRRAIEEACAANGVACPLAGAAHRRMAAVYAIRMREEQIATAALEAMLDVLGDQDHASDTDSDKSLHYG